MFKGVLYGFKDDIEKLLEWLSKKDLTWDIKQITQELYKDKDVLQFRKYFKRVYSNNWVEFDPLLCRDLEVLKIAGVIGVKNGKIVVDRKAMAELLYS